MSIFNSLYTIPTTQAKMSASYSHYVSPFSFFLSFVLFVSLILYTFSNEVRMWISCLLDTEHTDGQTAHLEHWTVQDGETSHRAAGGVKQYISTQSRAGERR